MQRGVFTILSGHPVISAIYYEFSSGDGLFGVFNVDDQKEFCKCCLQNGIYGSELTENSVVVKNGQMRVPPSVEIFSFSGQRGVKIEPLESFFF